jgi:branched-chain amino acid transport system substrate-binding protein
VLGVGFTQAATVHDKKIYGQGLVENFTKAFQSGGGTVVAAETINPDDKDFSAVIAKIKSFNPKVLYYGGEYPQAGPLSQQMKSAGLNIPLIGGDGIFDPKFISLAGPAAEGDLATNVGAPPEKLPGAAAFVKAYQDAGYSESYGAYGMYAYDAANAIIKAAAVALQNAADVTTARRAEIDAVSKTNFQGATGTVAFDAFGDAKARVLTVYEVTGGAWTAKLTQDFQ